jgi:hypothetical protein
LAHAVGAADAARDAGAAAACTLRFGRYGKAFSIALAHAFGARADPAGAAFRADVDERIAAADAVANAG